jgi:hypothetical protein
MVPAVSAAVHSPALPLVSEAMYVQPVSGPALPAAGDSSRYLKLCVLRR